MFTLSLILVGSTALCVIARAKVKTPLTLLEVERWAKRNRLRLEGRARAQYFFRELSISEHRYFGVFTVPVGSTAQEFESVLRAFRAGRVTTNLSRKTKP